MLRAYPWENVFLVRVCVRVWTSRVKKIIHEPSKCVLVRVLLWVYMCVRVDLFFISYQCRPCQRG